MQQPPPAGDAGATAPAAMPPDDGAGPLTDIIMQTDQALASLAQVLAKASPEAGQAIAALGEQFRAVIQSVMSGAEGQGQGQGQEQGEASQMVDPHSQGKSSQLSY